MSFYKHFKVGVRLFKSLGTIIINNNKTVQTETQPLHNWTRNHKTVTPTTLVFKNLKKTTERQSCKSGNQTSSPPLSALSPPPSTHLFLLSRRSASFAPTLFSPFHIHTNPITGDNKKKKETTKKQSKKYQRLRKFVVFFGFSSILYQTQKTVFKFFFVC